MMGGRPSAPIPKVPPLGVIPDPSKAAEALTCPLPDLPKREWRKMPQTSEAELHDPNSFTIATYNVMADIWSPPYNYPHLPPWAVTWPYRGRMMVKEMDWMKPDVLAIQELGKDAEQTLTPSLAERGYKSIYKVNPSGEGCGIYWKDDKFELVDSRLSDYNSLAKIRIDTNDTGGPLQQKLCDPMRTLSHHNVFALAVLKHKNTGRLALVISTHLYWGGDQHWNRQMQMMQAILLLDDVIAPMFPVESMPALFLCGDFNSRPPPDEQGLYLLLHNGSVPKDNIVWTMNGVRKDLADASPEPTFKLAKSVTLKSAYSVSGKEAAYTHYSHGFSATIDFIYCEPAKVKTLEMLQPFAKSEMPYGLPLLNYAGDHICMSCRFSFVQP